MKISFLGTGGWLATQTSDAPTLLINDRIMIDTGWKGLLSLNELGIDPLAIKLLLFTHFHHDHYLGLPQLLFYRGLKKAGGLPIEPLVIAGPQEYLAQILAASWRFLQLDRFPELANPIIEKPLSGGETITVDDLDISCFSTRHVSSKGFREPALSYRFSSNDGGRDFVYSGDTSFHPPLAAFAKDCELMVHDVAHTLPGEAAQIALLGGVGRLHLIHRSAEDMPGLVAEARQVFPNTFASACGTNLSV